MAKKKTIAAGLLQGLEDALALSKGKSKPYLAKISNERQTNSSNVAKKPSKRA